MDADGLLEMFHCPYEGCSQVYVALSSFQVRPPSKWAGWDCFCVGLPARWVWAVRLVEGPTRPLQVPLACLPCTHPAPADLSLSHREAAVTSVPSPPALQPQPSCLLNQPQPLSAHPGGLPGPGGSPQTTPLPAA